jgi:Cu(I)/Ag(I) efflux system membrane protein CusA/SilA
MIGGMVSAPLLSLFVVPAAYWLMRRRAVREASRPAP